MRTFRTTTLLAAAVILTAACTGESAVNKSPAAEPPGGLGSFYQQKMSWKNCGDRFECGSFRVPLDYTEPSGDRLTIHAIRLPARGERIGSLVTNPGGPGGSGINFVRAAGGLFSNDLRDRFDIVGFDPRGVGKSDPVRCMTSRQMDRFLAVDSSPDDQREEAEYAAASQGFATACDAKAEKLLPYVGTVSAARDIDIFRAALGDEKLTYFGASYGTYLGAFYAEQFPDKVRALALDGAVDPKLSADEISLEQGKGFETALRAFAADCLSTAGCPLGTGSVEDGVNEVSKLLAQADRQPLGNATGDGRAVTESLAVLGIAAALYAKESWPALRVGLDHAIRGGDGTILLRLADQLIERRQNGTYSNQTEANMAVNCVDKPYPGGLPNWQKQAAAAAKAAPRFGEFVVYGYLPCAYWPARTTGQPRALAAAGANPIVVIGTTRDPATPYEWSKSMAEELESGVLLTLDGDGHTAYLQGDRCIVAAVDRYLIEEKAPKEGTVCT